MKFETKLWKRTNKSFATTIPQALLFRLDLSKKYYIEWDYISKQNKWAVDFVEKKKQDKLNFYTALWKRSQRSYATTIPHMVLLHINEEKEYKIEWTFDSKLKKWMIELREVVK